MKPSIGRIVHYAPLTSDATGVWVAPAIITRVHADHHPTPPDLREHVDLTVFAPAHTFYATRIPHDDEAALVGMVRPQERGTWRWPPQVT